MVTVLKISFSSSSYELFHILSTFLSIKALTEVSIYGAPFKSKFKLFWYVMHYLYFFAYSRYFNMS